MKKFWTEEEADRYLKYIKANQKLRTLFGYTYEEARKYLENNPKYIEKQNLD